MRKGRFQWLPLYLVSNSNGVNSNGFWILKTALGGCFKLQRSKF